jgi:hypothetical protein
VPLDVSRGRQRVGLEFGHCGLTFGRLGLFVEVIATAGAALSATGPEAAARQMALRYDGGHHVEGFALN